jgi:Tfp pilus assembly protein PilP
MIMRIAKILRTLMLLGLPAVLATCALAQQAPNVKPSDVRNQLANQTPGAAQPAPAGAKAPAPKVAAAPAKAPAKEASQNGAKPPVETPAEEKATVTHRDPFETLVNRAKAGNAAPENLPPGKAGLIVGTLRVDGIVRGSGGMIAIVSNPQQRVYFLREGDKLYDGSVGHITLEAISFQEVGKDAFGKPLERQVTKRLYPSPGEQQ